MWYEDARAAVVCYGRETAWSAANDRRLDSPAGPKGSRKLPPARGQEV